MEQNGLCIAGKRLFGALLVLASFALAAEEEDAVVVTATRAPRPSLEIPASVDRLYGDELREGRAQVNLSESLGRVPGIVVQNRQNYAQDLQISSRGFGARATFGVRGIRLIADGIPATMPDGQGQAATFALGSAERIEVLRGPFSALYGNAAGGVIAVDTQDGPEVPAGEASLSLGSYDTWRAGVKYGGQWGRTNAIADLSRFRTDGYREHSAARRDHLNAKLKFQLEERTSLTVVANSLRQPDSQDPGGLDRAAFEADPRQPGPSALQFDTRKTVNQDQAGLRLQHRLGGTTSLEAIGYAGQRDVQQFLGFRGDFGLSSGGVVDLDRGYAGGALRISTGEALRISAGVEYDRMDERRKGFVNENGTVGVLRRDEDDVVSSTDVYLQGEWRFAERWSAHGGLRASRVEFRSTDYFIGGGNPDDSGSRDYSATTPLAGLLYRARPNLSFYANLGRGFETPTFAELAHSSTGSGLNFELDAARSRHAELGLKALWRRLGRVNAALFDIRTKDEIVVDTSGGGRTVFKNAARTSRRGLELAAETLAPGPWDLQLAYTWLQAEFSEGFTAGTTPIPAGNLIPGVPKSQTYAQLRYRRPGSFAALEGIYRSRVPVNDANSEFADGFGVLNVVGGLSQEGRGWRLSEFVRIDNLGDKRYAGSVIVNDGNGRYYEPAPGRNLTLGIQARLEL
jgi:iron complex outermembrane receptor protein